MNIVLLILVYLNSLPCISQKPASSEHCVIDHVWERPHRTNAEAEVQREIEIEDRAAGILPDTSEDEPEFYDPLVNYPKRD